MKHVNVMQGILEVIIMIAGSRCVGPWVNGLSGCVRCANTVVNVMMTNETDGIGVPEAVRMIAGMRCARLGKNG